MIDEVGWSVMMQPVQTGHGIYERARCLVYTPERGEARLVACVLGGELQHADSYNPWRTVPLAALQLLLEADGWSLTPSPAELKHREEVRARHERVEKRLREDPKFAAMVAAAEARSGKGEQP